MVWRRVLHRFVKASGPERLSAEWQSMDLRLQLVPASIEAAQAAAERYYFEGRHTRDYYIAEDAEGRRFWLFRSGLLGLSADPRWFMHGIFG